MWVKIPLQSLKLQILRLFQARSSLPFWQLQSGFTLNRICDMIGTCSQNPLIFVWFDMLKLQTPKWLKNTECGRTVIETARAKHSKVEKSVSNRELFLRNLIWNLCSKQSERNEAAAKKIFVMKSTKKVIAFIWWSWNLFSNPRFIF